MYGIAASGGMHEMMLNRYDKDGDGKISAAEKREAKADKMKRLDTNGDGKVSTDEKQAAKEFMNRNGGSGHGPGQHGGAPRGHGNNQNAKSIIDVQV
ncbi:MAG: hypothetical protein ACI8RA_001735 [Chlamydiales bacterium]|jgi:hypothetical protein